jgi:hypothetical protein
LEDELSPSSRENIQQHTENTMGNMDKEQEILPHKFDMIVPIRKTVDKNNIHS